MARPLRIQFPGALYHVISRGNERNAIVRDDAEREKRLDWLRRTVEMYGWRLHALVLMTNHEHLFVETPEANLSAAAIRAISTGVTAGAGTFFKGDSRGISSRSRDTSWESAGTVT